MPFGIDLSCLIIIIIKALGHNIIRAIFRTPISGVIMSTKTKNIVRILLPLVSLLVLVATRKAPVKMP